ncbi:MAG TPA: Crp/Fnr family transcriptional regulator [Bradyrhizobium sp.]|nr:Crp/Fnr family transcriptional regulator [Bradyrhizobium sp.]
MRAFAEPETRKMLPQPSERPFVRNEILARMSLPDLAMIGEFLEHITLKERMILQEPRKRVEHVYFIESGVISLRVVSAGSILETAVVGQRGAIGVSFLFGGHVPTHQSIVLFGGSALRIRVDDLRRVMNERPQVKELLARHVQTLLLHCAQTGLCGVRHDLEQRLASWLCLTSDALDGHVLPVTHEYLSAALGLRRAGVTQTLNRFEDEGLIRKMRGVLQIDERKNLEKKTCNCYGVIASAYASPAMTAGSGSAVFIG